jgi:hypothetical protein
MVLPLKRMLQRVAGGKDLSLVYLACSLSTGQDVDWLRLANLFVFGLSESFNTRLAYEVLPMVQDAHNSCGHAALTTYDLPTSASSRMSVRDRFFRHAFFFIER